MKFKLEDYFDRLQEGTTILLMLPILYLFTSLGIALWLSFGLSYFILAAGVQLYDELIISKAEKKKQIAKEQTKPNVQKVKEKLETSPIRREPLYVPVLEDDSKFSQFLVPDELVGKFNERFGTKRPILVNDFNNFIFKNLSAYDQISYFANVHRSKEKLIEKFAAAESETSSHKTQKFFISYFDSAGVVHAVSDLEGEPVTQQDVMNFINFKSARKILAGEKITEDVFQEWLEKRNEAKKEVVK
jgi:hypothetical protein